MATIKLDRVVADFKAPATGDKTVRLKDLRGKKVVLYFYPRDNTPGCTSESQDFAELHTKFRRQKAVILGISRDSLKSHEKFKDKFEFPFDLISDEDEKLCQQFDVIKDKNMYGKKVRGIERSTFLIDDKGKLRKEWRKVKVNGHADEVLDAVKEI
ncbi:MAG: peroxiredoxin [Gammaproteobacteria bacterium]|nr:peroxiredoxin [Gammaproteobacteria bacterium]NNF67978.1 peroxiredoxin [Gammaproteobacteria bacterium]